MLGPTLVRPAVDRPLDILSAAAFLEAAASPLHQALARPGCHHSVAHAMSLQDRAHGSWIALVDTARRGGDDELVAALMRLYGFHGTVAGRLEQGFPPLLAPSSEERMRLLLIKQLRRLTARAVRGLLAHSVSPSPVPGGGPSGAPCGWPRRGARPRR